MGKSHSRKTNTQDEGRNKVQFGLLGEMRVGKTALVSQFLRHQVDPDYDPTLEDKFVFFYFNNRKRKKGCFFEKNSFFFQLSKGNSVRG